MLSHSANSFITYRRSTNPRRRSMKLKFKIQPYQTTAYRL